MKKYEVNIKTISGESYSTVFEIDGTKTDLLEIILKEDVVGFIPWFGGCESDGNISVYIFLRNVEAILVTGIKESEQ